MSNTREILEEIYPAIYERAAEVFPEFGFRLHGNKYVSTTGQKVNGETGSAGKVYLYSNNPGRLIDFTRGNKSLWDYIAERDGLGGNAAVLERLSDLSGVKLPPSSSDAYKAIHEAKKRAELWEDVNDFLLDCLSGRDNKHAQSPEAHSLRHYLTKERGYTANQIRLPGEAIDPDRPPIEFGFIPSASALFDYLRGRGHESAFIHEVIKLDSRIGTTHRLTLPWRDYFGRIRGIVARSINPAEDPRYLYSTGLERGRFLFNLRPMKQDRDLVIVEGVLDALVPTSLGFHNVAAIGGAHLSAEHIKQIERARPARVTLCPDNDKAGAEATPANLELLQNLGLRLYVAELPEGIKDADELIRKHGPAAFTSLVDHAITLSDYHINRITRKFEELGELTPKQTDELFDEIADVGGSFTRREDADYFVNQLKGGFERIGYTSEAFDEAVQKVRERRKAEEVRSRAASLTSGIPQLIKDLGPEEALREIRDKAGDILASGSGGSAIATYENVLASLRKSDTAYRTGYASLDSFAGFPSGAISLIAGRPSHGKTSFMFNSLLQMVELYPDRSFYFFTYEEPVQNIWVKLLNAMTNRDYSSTFGMFPGLRKRSNYEFIKAYLRSGGGGLMELDETNQRLRDYVEGGRIRLVDHSYTVEGLGEFIPYKAKRERIGAVFIDYVQRLTTERKYQDLRLQVAHISNTVLQTAKESNLPIILGAQLNRAAAASTSKEPVLENLKEAGNLEEDANTVLSVWNEAKEKDEAEDGSRYSDKREVTLKIKALKNREGEVNKSAELTLDKYTGLIKQNKADAWS